MTLIWHAFADMDPPTSPRLDNPSITGFDQVLVTNNIEARDAMGRMSHVWYAMPFILRTAESLERNGGNPWIGDVGIGVQTIYQLSHWANPHEVEPAPRVDVALETAVHAYCEANCIMGFGITLTDGSVLMHGPRSEILAMMPEEVPRG